MRLSELDELHNQAMRHALYAEQLGSLKTAVALRRVAAEIEEERRSLLGSNVLRLEEEDMELAAASRSAAAGF